MFYRLCIRNPASELPPNYHKLEKWQWLIIVWYDVIVNFFFDGVLFLLLSLVIDPGFLSVSSLVVELSQFSYVRDWPEIRNSEVPPSESSDLISGGLGKLGIPDLARMSLIKCYWMLENARITGFTISELINQQRGGGGG